MQLAKKFGARWTLLVESRGSRVEGKEIPVLDPRPSTLDAAIIAVPSDDAVTQAFQLVRGGGQILLFAHTKRAEVGSRKSEIRNPASDLRPPTSAFSLDPASICVDEKDLIGSYSSDFTIQAEAARLVFSRRLDVRRLISHSFPLAQTADAIALAASPGSGSLKIMVLPGDDPGRGTPR